MTDHEDLERRYRRLLGCYPRSFRQRNGEEILGVLMATARDGQRRPGLAESADLVRHGVRMRVRAGEPASRSVRAAVRLMHAGAALSTVGLVLGMALLAVDAPAVVRESSPGGSLAGRRLVVIAASAAFGLVVVALWLWMARANARGRGWARLTSTALFAVATVRLPDVLSRPPSPAAAEVTVLYLGGVVPFAVAWLAGAATVWLLWSPSSTAFFQRAGHDT